MDSEGRQPRRFRFSLLNLLLLIALVACAALIYRQQQNVAAMHREVQPLRDEVAKYRNESGGLDIADPEKIYAIAMPGNTTDEWRYRVYLPEGRRYLVAYRVNDLPIGGAAPQEIPMPSGNTIGSTENGGYCTIEPGERIVRVALLKRNDGEWAVQFTTQQAGSPTPGSSTGGNLGEGVSDRWPEVRSRAQATGGVFGQQAFAPQLGTIVLLDHRSWDSAPGQSSADAPEGIMVWLQTAP
ncbi:hypothetical protein [Botrimarina hoheduenensis]|uniref:Uncharacterized protein n=1 Tax=Botrimarina hoheduenensis TaxID=2528000 RepID=A0A5C5WDW2_9BACT|nr:hypothetical protein [Botrimarina hoheduenensis]TWT48647.1 hypothetical protein Pla111_04220 [Botrimarina hoheduenensis]